MKALLVVDVQNEFSLTGKRPVPDFYETVKVIRGCVTEARNEGWPIAWVKHFNLPTESPAFIPGTVGADFIPDFGPKTGTNLEVEFQKTVFGAFTGSALGEWLAEQEVDDVLIVGFYTHMCVSTTAREALMRGLHVTINSNGTGACDLSHPYLGTQTASEVKRSALLQLVNLGVKIDFASMPTAENMAISIS